MLRTKSRFCLPLRSSHHAVANGKSSRLVHFWLRAESKPQEERTILLPEHTKKLLEEGHKVTVEKSKQRCIPAEEYSSVGCELEEEGAWVHNAPLDAIVCGLKELPPSIPIRHKHVYFAHCFKGQAGSVETLRRFKEGGGKLWDLEFLNLPSGRRVAAFSKAAGKVGAGLGFEAWAHRKQGGKLPKQDKSFQTFSDLITHSSALLAQVAPSKPKMLVIGALGQSGSGACQIAESAGITPVKWDLEETKKGGPFPELLDFDILVNCIYIHPSAPKTAPFLTKELLEKKGNLSVLVDVSCDTTNPNSPFPIYSTETSFNEPTLDVKVGQNSFEVIAIDHLPSLVPYESSLEFGSALLPFLSQFDQSDTWHNALQLFNTKVHELVK